MTAAIRAVHMETKEMSETLFVEPLTISVPDAMRRTGLGRTKLYELIGSGEIESVLIGTRRLIVFESLKSRLTRAKERDVGNAR